MTKERCERCRFSKRSRWGETRPVIWHSPTSAPSAGITFLSRARTASSFCATTVRGTVLSSTVRPTPSPSTCFGVATSFPGEAGCSFFPAGGRKRRAPPHQPLSWVDNDRPRGKLAAHGGSSDGDHSQHEQRRTDAQAG